MAPETPAARIVCPGCSSLFDAREGDVVCLRCGESLRIFLFSPHEGGNASIPDAGVDDVPCLHHPRNKAETSCARCGSFICRLCAVEINTKTFCAKCLDAKERMEGHDLLATTLPRHDRRIISVLAFPIVLPFLYPLAIPYAVYQFRKISTESRRNPLAGRLYSTGRRIYLYIFSGFSVLWFLFLVVLLAVKNL